MKELTLEEVLKAGEPLKILGVELGYLFLPASALIIIAMFAFVYYADKFKETNMVKTNLLLFSGVLVGVFGLGTFFVFIPFKESEHIADWKKEYAYPYISQMETEIKEIEQVNLGFSKVEGEKSIRSKYTEGETDYSDLVPVEVTYKEDDSLKTLKIEAKVQYDLGKDETPYMEYIYLKDGLSDYVKEGYYNLIIHYKK